MEKASGAGFIKTSSCDSHFPRVAGQTCECIIFRMDDCVIITVLSNGTPMNVGSAFFFPPSDPLHATSDPSSLWRQRVTPERLDACTPAPSLTGQTNKTRLSPLQEGNTTSTPMNSDPAGRKESRADPHPRDRRAALDPAGSDWGVWRLKGEFGYFFFFSAEY